MKLPLIVLLGTLSVSLAVPPVVSNIRASQRPGKKLVDTTTPPAPPGMACIPPGPFQMGDSFTEGSTSERPVHNVQVSGFFMDKTEVNKALWEQVKAWGNANEYSISGGSHKGDFHPVHSVSWHTVVKWCNARSQREGFTPCYYTDEAQTTVYKTGDVALTNAMVKWSANGYRLPTEAEWEKAARGGTSGQRFPWGNTISHDEANFRNGGGKAYQTGTTGYHPTCHVDFSLSPSYTSPVGSFPANDYGLFDMAGNLWEWCWDWYDAGYYATPGSLDDPQGPDTAGSPRVLRGGYWGCNASGCRAAYRYRYNLSGTGNDIGFRTVRSSEGFPQREPDSDPVAVPPAPVRPARQSEEARPGPVGAAEAAPGVPGVPGVPGGRFGHEKGVPL